MEQTRRQVIRASMRTMLKEARLNVTTIRDCMKLAGKYEGNWTIIGPDLEVLHCVRFQEMEKELLDWILAELRRIFPDVIETNASIPQGEYPKQWIFAMLKMFGGSGEGGPE